MGPYGSENIKTLPLLQIAAESFQTFPEFSSQWSSQKLFGIFEILKIEILTIFILFVNVGPNGSKNYKTLLLLQIAAKRLETCLEFSAQWSSRNYFWVFRNFDFLLIIIFFFKIANSPLYPRDKLKTSIIWKTSDRRTKRSES